MSAKLASAVILALAAARAPGESPQPAARTPGTPEVSAGKDGFVLKSPDGEFVLKLRGYVQIDGRFFDGAAAADTFVVRRARPILEGTVFRIFDFRLMPDFGLGASVLQDGYVEARVLPALRLRAGKFKPPVGLERLQSATDLVFAERALPTNLVPNRDVGVQIAGDVVGARLQYAVGVFNGVPDGGSADADTDDSKDVAGRLFAHPFAGSGAALEDLGIGIAVSTGSPAGTVSSPNLPAYRTAGQTTFFAHRNDGTAAGTTVAAGSRRRVAPQATFYRGPFGFLAEYVRSKQEVRRGAARGDVSNTAWQGAASWVFGGTASDRGVSPEHPFAGRGSGPGAFEVAARYSAIDVGDEAFPVFSNPDTAARRARGLGVGVNWWANRNARVMLSYESTRFDGGATIGNRPDERVLVTRFQVSF